jgi:hypothetical protein
MSRWICTLQLCSTPPLWPFRQSLDRAQICHTGQPMLTAIMQKNTTRIHGAILAKTSRVASFMAYKLFKRALYPERSERFLMISSGLQREEVEGVSLR